MRQGICPGWIGPEGRLELVRTVAVDLVLRRLRPPLPGLAGPGRAGTGRESATPLPRGRPGQRTAHGGIERLRCSPPLARRGAARPP